MHDLLMTKANFSNRAVACVMLFLALLATPSLHANKTTWGYNHSSPIGEGVQPGYDAILVKFKEAPRGVTTLEKIKQKHLNLHRRLNTVPDTNFRHPHLARIPVPANRPWQALANSYMADDSVAFVEPDYPLYALTNDPLYLEQWGLSNLNYSDIDVNAEAAWQYSTGSSDLVIAVLDTGIAYDHPDLAGNMWINLIEQQGLPGVDDDGNGYIDDLHGIDTSNGDSDPYDTHGHGTHVAGVIGAVGDNLVGITGLAQQIKLLACNFLGSNGSGFVSDAIACLDYVRQLKQRGVNIVATNNSWGGGEYSQLLAEAIVAQDDILFVAAAGNSGQNNDRLPSYPASYNLANMVTVAAVDETGALAPFSNFGRQSVHLSAPGVDILSTLPVNNRLGADFYDFLSGTSMATPFVSAATALLKDVYPGDNGYGLRNRLLSSGLTLPSLGDTATGSLLDVEQAINCLNRSRLKPLSYPASFPQTESGNPEWIKVLNIDCANAAGSVMGATNNGRQIQFFDDGLNGDEIANDGIFTAEWLPQSGETGIQISASTGTITLPELTVVSNYLPELDENYPYSFQLNATGGQGSYSWQLTSGALPNGLILEQSGLISGMSTEQGVFNFTVMVTDQLGQTDTHSFKMLATGQMVEFWSTTVDEGLNEIVGDLAMDQLGNLYLIGRGQSPVDGKDDILVVKYGADHDELWRRRIDLGGIEWATGIVVVDDGIVISGSCPLFGCVSEFQLIKLSFDGQTLWTKSHGATNSQISTSLASDQQGNLYQAGYDLNNSFEYDLVLQKYDAQGSLLWRKVYDGQQIDRAFDLKVDESGNVYVVGDTARDVAGQMDYQYLVLKYDTDGNLLWQRTRYSGWVSAYSVDFDPDGNLVIVGGLSGHAVKYDRNGAFIQDRQLARIGSRLIVDRDGDLYVMEKEPFSLEYVLAKYDGDFNLIWDTPVGGVYYDNAVGFAVTEENHLFLARTFDNGTDQDFLISRYGNPPQDQQQIIVAPRMIEFGEVRSGETSPSAVVKVTNYGAGTLLIDNLQLVGRDSNLFEIDLNGCEGLSLAANKSCDISVRYHAPLQTGVYLATLSIPSNDGDNTMVSIGLQAETIPGDPQISLSTHSIDFPLNYVNQPLTRQLVLSNSGFGPLEIQSINSSGSSDLMRSGTCQNGLILAVGAQCDIQLTWTPVSSGVLKASLNLDTNASPSNTQLPISGDALIDPPSMTVDVSGIDFGTVVGGNSSLVETITISNSGTGDLSITNLSFDAAVEYPFSVVQQNCSATPLSANALCQIELKFTAPLEGGDFQSQFTVLSDDLDNPLSTINLAAIATPAPAVLGVSSGSLNFAEVEIGESAVVDLVVRNDGYSNLVLSSIEVSGSLSELTGDCESGTTLARDEFCTAQLTWTPRAEMLLSETLVIQANADAVSINISGQSLAAPQADNDDSRNGGGAFNPWLLLLIISINSLRRSIRRIIAITHVFQGRNLSLNMPGIFVSTASIKSTHWIAG